MPVRTYERKFFGGPHNLRVNGCSFESDEDIEKLNKSLVFLDLNTGRHNRGIVRDPICGLGDLPAEIDILDGCALKRNNIVSDSYGISPNRDPIRLEGNLGAEYNCLYTTKDLRCKPMTDRNVLTLKGDLGDELDQLRPHGGRPRNSIKSEVVRNPITGSGDFGAKEWDPIWKYDGKHVINRPEQVPRDPITHNVPLENMGQSAPKPHYKHFDILKDTNVIRHEETIKDLANNGQISHSGIRHFVNDTSRNPITHLQASGGFEEKPYRSGTRHFYDNTKTEDYISHHGLSDDIYEQTAKQEYARQQAQQRVINDPIGHYCLGDEVGEQAPKEKKLNSNNEESVPRNPITGMGINEKDIKITNQCFRNPNRNTSGNKNQKDQTAVKSRK